MWLLFRFPIPTLEVSFFFREASPYIETSSLPDDEEKKATTENKIKILGLSTKNVYEPVGRKIINKAGPDHEKSAPERKIITQTSDISLRAEESPSRSLFLLLLLPPTCFFSHRQRRKKKSSRDDENY